MPYDPLNMVALKSVIASARNAIEAHPEMDEAFTLCPDSVPDCNGLGLMCAKLPEVERNGLSQLLRMDAFLSAWRGEQGAGLTREYIASYADADLNAIEAIHRECVNNWDASLTERSYKN